MRSARVSAPVWENTDGTPYPAAFIYSERDDAS